MLLDTDLGLSKRRPSCVFLYNFIMKGNLLLSSLIIAGIFAPSFATVNKDEKIASGLAFTSYLHVYEVGKTYIEEDNETIISGYDFGEDIPLEFDYYLDKNEYDIWKKDFPYSNMDQVQMVINSESEKDLIWGTDTKKYKIDINQSNLKFNELTHGKYTLKGDDYMPWIDGNGYKFRFSPLYGARETSSNNDPVLLYGNRDKAYSTYEPIWIDFNKPAFDPQIWFKGENKHHSWWYEESSMISFYYKIDAYTEIKEVRAIVQDIDDKSFEKSYDITSLLNPAISYTGSYARVMTDPRTWTDPELEGRYAFNVQIEMDWESSKGGSGTISTATNNPPDATHTTKQMYFEKYYVSSYLSDYSIEEDYMEIAYKSHSGTGQDLSANRFEVNITQKESGYEYNEVLYEGGQTSYSVLQGTLRLTDLPEGAIELGSEFEATFTIGNIRHYNSWLGGKTLTETFTIEIPDDGIIPDIPDPDKPIIDKPPVDPVDPDDDNLPNWSNIKKIIYITLAFIGVIIVIAIVIKIIKK